MAWRLSDLAGHRVRDDLASGMANSRRLPDQTQQQLLREVRVDLATSAEVPRINQLLNERHYLGRLRPVGERLYYIARNAANQWVAVLVFSAAANHLKHRDEWIGWTNEQRRRRLSLVTNNSRFLLLPDFSVPNLAAKSLGQEPTGEQPRVRYRLRRQIAFFKQKALIRAHQLLGW